MLNGKDSGKLILSSVAAPTGNKSLARRLFISDRYNYFKFLIGTGSIVSVIPPTGKTEPSQYYLYAANGSKISTYGERILTLNLGLRRPFCWQCKLNSVTILDSYPILHIYDFSANLSGSCIFSRIDLIKAFNQISVADEDISKTAVFTPFGLFEFVRMPFGLCNAPQTFQRFIDDVLRGLPFAYAYLDDVPIASYSEVEHLALTYHFREISRIWRHNKRHEMSFWKTRINFFRS